MNEEALKTMYELAQKEGYTKSQEDFVNLLNSDQEAFDTMYSLAQREGYNKSSDDFSSLLGLKKKAKTQPQEEATTSVSETPAQPSTESGEGTLRDERLAGKPQVPDLTEANKKKEELDKQRQEILDTRLSIEKAYAPTPLQKTIDKSQDDQNIQAYDNAITNVKEQINGVINQAKQTEEQIKRANDFVFKLPTSTQADNLYEVDVNGEKQIVTGESVQQYRNNLNNLIQLSEQQQKQYEQLAKKQASLFVAKKQYQLERSKELRQIVGDAVREDLNPLATLGAWMYGSAKSGLQAMEGSVGVAMVVEDEIPKRSEQQMKSVSPELRAILENAEKERAASRSKEYLDAVRKIEASVETSEMYGIAKTLDDVDVTNVQDYLSYIVGAFGEQLPQYAQAIFTLGYGTYLQELGSMQQEVIQRLMTERELTLEQALESEEVKDFDLKMNAIGIAAVDQLGMLAMGAGKLIKPINKISKIVRNARGVQGAAIGTVGEVATEITQEAMAKAGVSSVLGEGYLKGLTSLSGKEIAEVTIKTLIPAGSMSSINSFTNTGKVNQDMLDVATTNPVANETMKGIIRTREKAGIISTEEADRQIAELNASIAANLQIPESIQGEQRARIVELQKEYNALAEEQKRVPPAFKEMYKQKMDAVQEKIAEIVNQPQKKDEIERRRQEELEAVNLAIAKSNETGKAPTVNGQLVNKNTIKEINAKYDAELAELEQRTTVEQYGDKKEVESKKADIEKDITIETIDDKNDVSADIDEVSKIQPSQGITKSINNIKESINSKDRELFYNEVENLAKQDNSSNIHILNDGSLKSKELVDNYDNIEFADMSTSELSKNLYQYGGFGVTVENLTSENGDKINYSISENIMDEVDPVVNRARFRSKEESGNKHNFLEHSLGANPMLILSGDNVHARTPKKESFISKVKNIFKKELQAEEGKSVPKELSNRVNELKRVAKTKDSFKGTFIKSISQQQKKTKEDIDVELQLGKERVSELKRTISGAEKLSFPFKIYKGLGGKKDIQGQRINAHKGVDGVFASIDKGLAEEYSRGSGMSEIEIPSGTTLEVVEVDTKGKTPEQFRAEEVEAINNSRAQIVKLITIDGKIKAGEKKQEQYIIKDESLIKQVQDAKETNEVRKEGEQVQAEETGVGDMREIDQTETTQKAVEEDVVIAEDEITALEQEIAQEEERLSKEKQPAKTKEKKQEPQTLVTPKALDFLGKEVVDENGNVGTIKQEGEGRLVFESEDRILELGSADNVADVTLAEYGLSVKPEEITDGTTVEKKQTKEGQRVVPQTKTEGAEATTEAIMQEEEYLEKTNKELEEMEKKAEEDVKAFEEIALEEAAKKSANKDLVQVGDNIFQVTKKDDGTFTVSQMREDGRLIPIGEKNTNRNKAIGAFKSKKSNTERRALAEAQKLVDEFRQGEQDKILNFLDQAIAATSNQGRAFDATIGIPISMLNSALKIVRAAYKAGKSLTEAIQDAIEHLKKQGYSPNELELKKRILKDLKKDAKKQQGGQVRKQGVQEKKQGRSDKDMSKSDRTKLQDGEKKQKKTSLTSETQGLTEKERTKQGVEELVAALKEKSRENLSNVTNKFREEIKRRAKTLKDFKDRKKAIEGFAKDLLKELKKSGVKYIPTRKVQSIINSIAAAKTDKSLNTSAQKLIDTVNEIAVTDEEVKQRAKINKLKSQAKKNRKTKAGQLSNEISTILSLDDVPPSLQKEYESVLEQIGQRGAILSIDDIAAIKELARKIDEEYKVEETISEEEETETLKPEDKQEELASAELELKLIPDNTDLGSRDKNNAAYSFKKLTLEFLATLPKTTLKNIAKEARNIQNGFMSNGFVEGINNKFEGFQKGQEIAKNKSAITSSNSRFKDAVKKANKMAKQAMKTQLNHIDTAFKSIKNTSLYENLVSPLTRAFQQSSVETKEFVKDITSLAAKAISSRNRLRRFRDNTEAKFRLNVILDLFLIEQQHQQNPNSKLTPSSESIVETINEDVKKEGSKSGYTEKDLSIINDVYENAPKKDGRIDLEAYKKNYLTSAERKLLEYIEDTYIKYQDKAIYVSEQLRGETLEMFNAYAPRNTVTQKEMTTADKMDAWKGKTKQASSTKKRSETAPLVRLGGVTNAIGYVSEINEDYYVTKAVRQVDATLKYLKENLEGDNKKFAQQLQNFMDNHVREQYEKIHTKDNQGERLFKEVVRGVYSNLLVNFFGRLPKELASNLVVGSVELKNMIRARSNSQSGLMLKNTPKLMRKFGSAHLDRVGNLTIDLREVEGSPIGRGFKTTDIGSFEKFNDIVANNVVKDISKLANKLYYSIADVMLRPAWSFELMAEFKKETGQELNADKLLNDDKYYLDNKQAIDRALARADKHVSDLYNTASQFERRLDQKQAKSTFKQMTKFFMQSFSFNENSVMSSAAKSIVGQGNMGHQEAAAKLTAVIGRMMVYSGWSSVLASMVYGLFGDDDEELKDVVEMFGGEREYSEKTISDFFLKGGADILGIALFGKQVAWAKTGINTALNAALEGYEKATGDERFKTSKGYYPFFGVNYNNVGYRDMGRFLGGLGTFATTGIDLGVNTIKVLQKEFNGEEPTDKQKLKLQLSGMSLIAAMLGLPLAKDAEKFIKQMNKEEDKASSGIKTPNVKLPDIKTPKIKEPKIN